MRAAAPIGVEDDLAPGLPGGPDRYEECENFPEVGADLLHSSLWKTIGWNKWNHEENILILEARALVHSCAGIASRRDGSNKRQLLFCDNMSATLAFGR